MNNQRKNNWYVVTGGPCSGKTTLLQYLKSLGYHVEFEIARLYIDQELKKGKTLGEIRKNEAGFQMEVLKRKIKLEKTLSQQEQIFLERGIADSVAKCTTRRYDLSFHQIGPRIS